MGIIAARGRKDDDRGSVLPVKYDDRESVFTRYVALRPSLEIERHGAEY
jgi:hypothetical protein